MGRKTRFLTDFHEAALREQNLTRFCLLDFREEAFASDA